MRRNSQETKEELRGALESALLVAMTQVGAPYQDVAVSVKGPLGKREATKAHA